MAMAGAGRGRGGARAAAGGRAGGSRRRCSAVAQRELRQWPRGGSAGAVGEGGWRPEAAQRSEATVATGRCSPTGPLAPAGAKEGVGQGGGGRVRPGTQAPARGRSDACTGVDGTGSW